MLVTTNIRNWGNGSDPQSLMECAKAAETARMDTVWVNDRLSTPDNRGWKASDGGRYLDPLMALTYICAVTTNLRLGTGVLNLPYRLPFQMVKQVATLQDLSRGRLRFGVGVGWYETEFKVLGVPFGERGKLTNAALDLLRDAFEHDVVEVNGAELPVLPRPARPPIYVGGRSDAALKRVVRYGDGWIAAGLTPDELKAPMHRLVELAEQAGRKTPKTIAMKTLPLENVAQAIELASAYAECGVAELVHADGYSDVNDYKTRLDTLSQHLLHRFA